MGSRMMPIQGLLQTKLASLERVTSINWAEKSSPRVSLLILNTQMILGKGENKKGKLRRAKRKRHIGRSPSAIAIKKRGEQYPRTRC